MKRIAPAMVILAALASPPAQCEEQAALDPIEARKIPRALSAEAKSLVESNNRFALDLYTEIRKQPGNLFFSPYGISTTLAMAYAGAAGKTQSEMAGVLHFDPDQEKLHPSYRALVTSLNQGSQADRYELHVANALWPQSGYSFLESFLTIPTKYYEAILEELDYSADAEACRGRINSWVEERTKGKVRELLPPMSVTALTRLVLTNAVYFKGLWAHEFDPGLTGSRKFTRSDGSEVDVPMMIQMGEFRLGEPKGLKILELPYRGRDLSMLILLPDEADGVPSLEAQLGAGALDGWISSLGTATVDVMIPKFTTASFLNLGEALSGMGMPSAFDSKSADFSGMTGTRDLFIGGVFHKAFVEVTEEGTEAAAATGMSMDTLSLGSVFAADHPFLFLIRDHVTGSILFMGRVEEPLR